MTDLLWIEQRLVPSRSAIFEEGLLYGAFNADALRMGSYEKATTLEWDSYTKGPVLPCNYGAIRSGSRLEWKLESTIKPGLVTVTLELVEFVSNQDACTILDMQNLPNIAIVAKRINDTIPGVLLLNEPDFGYSEIGDAIVIHGHASIHNPSWVGSWFQPVSRLNCSIR